MVKVSIEMDENTVEKLQRSISRYGKLFISYHPAAALHGTPREVLKKDFKKLGESQWQRPFEPEYLAKA